VQRLRSWALASIWHRQVSMLRALRDWRALAAEMRLAVECAGLLHETQQTARVLLAWRTHASQEAREKLLVELQLTQVASGHYQRVLQVRGVAAGSRSLGCHTRTA
jgi:hypothetical protein